ncbi:MAG: hypothetical protein HRU19_08465 [Pseudobacteriovorax sp.]|nr:hypothetical protein [Pseudobacteriovorax sp.]
MLKLNKIALGLALSLLLPACGEDEESKPTPLTIDKDKLEGLYISSFYSAGTEDYSAALLASQLVLIKEDTISFQTGNNNFLCMGPRKYEIELDLIKVEETEDCGSLTLRVTSQSQSYLEIDLVGADFDSNSYSFTRTNEKLAEVLIANTARNLEEVNSDFTDLYVAPYESTVIDPHVESLTDFAKNLTLKLSPKLLVRDDIAILKNGKIYGIKDEIPAGETTCYLSGLQSNDLYPLNLDMLIVNLPRSNDNLWSFNFGPSRGDLLNLGLNEAEIDRIMSERTGEFSAKAVFSNTWELVAGDLSIQCSKRLSQGIITVEDVATALGEYIEFAQ